ncbi:hypothetical protein PoB_002255600 [Plakobranchus ocellatus]|uniref:Uncharacterized protein n=1 Tax=Plakobranchus ocellatus TaxID=259542 RepID=A0AAV3Z9T5_9GAST|nr:hypothetical protein PoB_002255600 [Plakobranchus ocellatus]
MQAKTKTKPILVRLRSSGPKQAQYCTEIVLHSATTHRVLIRTNAITQYKANPSTRILPHTPWPNESLKDLPMVHGQYSTDEPITDRTS